MWNHFNRFRLSRKTWTFSATLATLFLMWMAIGFVIVIALGIVLLLMIKNGAHTRGQQPVAPSHIHSPSQLTICELNAENLFISLEHWDNEDLHDLTESQWRGFALPQLRHKQKPLYKIWGLAEAIFDINPDILLLIEVGGKESLEHFTSHFLKKTYIPHFVETNSNRSIDLAFLVKADLPLRAEALSNRHLPVTMDTYHSAGTPTRLSRDVAELRLFEGSRLALVILLVHLKSKISSVTDFQGRDLRRAEATVLAAHYKKIANEHPKVPIIVSGDFNSELDSPELESLKLTDLLDFQELVGHPQENRISLVHFDYHGKAHPQTLDYILVSPHLKERIVREKSYTYRYKSFYDTPHPLPTTIHQRYHMPSDHYPLVLTMEW